MSMNAKGVQYTPGEAYGREFRPFGRCKNGPISHRSLSGQRKKQLAGAHARLSRSGVTAIFLEHANGART
jgi:hypothetical protein